MTAAKPNSCGRPIPAPIRSRSELLRHLIRLVSASLEKIQCVSAGTARRTLQTFSSDPDPFNRRNLCGDHYFLLELVLSQMETSSPTAWLAPWPRAHERTGSLFSLLAFRRVSFVFNRSSCCRTLVFCIFGLISLVSSSIFVRHTEITHGLPDSQVLLPVFLFWLTLLRLARRRL